MRANGDLVKKRLLQIESQPDLASRKRDRYSARVDAPQKLALALRDECESNPFDKVTIKMFVCDVLFAGRYTPRLAIKFSGRARK